MKYIQFEGSASGFVTKGLDRKMVEGANKKAQEWIQKNPEAKVFSINSSLGRMLAIVTIWYE